MRSRLSYKRTRRRSIQWGSVYSSISAREIVFPNEKAPTNKALEKFRHEFRRKVSASGPGVTCWIWKSRHVISLSYIACDLGHESPRICFKITTTDFTLLAFVAVHHADINFSGVHDNTIRVATGCAFEDPTDAIHNQSLTAKTIKAKKTLRNQSSSRSSPQTKSSLTKNKNL